MEIGDVLVEIELTSLMERLVVDVPEVEDRLEEKSQRKHENTRLKTWRDDPLFFCSLNSWKNKGNNILLFSEKRDLKARRTMGTNSIPTSEACVVFFFFVFFVFKNKKQFLKTLAKQALKNKRLF